MSLPLNLLRVLHGFFVKGQVHQNNKVIGKM